MNKISFFSIVCLLFFFWGYKLQAQESNFDIDTSSLGSIEVDPNTGQLYEVFIDMETGKIARTPLPELQKFICTKIEQNVDEYNSGLKKLWSQHTDKVTNRNYKLNTVLPKVLSLFINEGKNIVNEVPVLRRAFKDASRNVWYYVDAAGNKKDVSQKRLLPMLIIGSNSTYRIVGSCQNNVWYEYMNGMTSTSKQELRRKYPDAQETMGYMVSPQITIPSAKVQVASITSGGKKKLKSYSVPTYLKNVIQASEKGTYKYVDLNWTQCKFSKFRQINDSVYECVAKYNMTFKGYSGDMYMVYGDKTCKSVTVRIIHRSVGPTDKWIIKFGDINVDDAIRLR